MAVAVADARVVWCCMEWCRHVKKCVSCRERYATATTSLQQKTKQKQNKTPPRYCCMIPVLPHSLTLISISAPFSLSRMPPYSIARKCSDLRARWTRLAYTGKPSTMKVTSLSSRLLTSFRMSSWRVGGGTSSGWNLHS